jgi:hypothetical protein
MQCVTQEQAFQAYADRDFKTAVEKLTEIMQQQSPQEAKFLEMRAQVLVDGKAFDAAVKDYDAAMALTTGEKKEREGGRKGRCCLHVPRPLTSSPFSKTSRPRAGGAGTSLCGQGARLGGVEQVGASPHRLSEGHGLCTSSRVSVEGPRFRA